MTCPMPKGEPCAECGGRWLCLKGARKQKARFFIAPPPTEPKAAKYRQTVMAPPKQPQGDKPDASS